MQLAGILTWPYDNASLSSDDESFISLTSYQARGFKWYLGTWKGG